jgi:hypothetical protein
MNMQVARAPQPARPVQLRLERLYQRSLADTRLTRHQHQPTATVPGLGRIPGQHVQERRPLKQLHRLTPNSLQAFPPPRSTT